MSREKGVRKPASPAMQALAHEVDAARAYVRWLEKTVGSQAADGAASRLASTIRDAVGAESLKVSGVSYPGLYARTRYARTRGARKVSPKVSPVGEW